MKKSKAGQGYKGIHLDRDFFIRGKRIKVTTKLTRKTDKRRKRNKSDHLHNEILYLSSMFSLFFT